MTYKIIMIEEFEENARWVLGNILNTVVDFNVVKDECLIPGRTNCLVQHFCALTVFAKRSPDIAI